MKAKLLKKLRKQIVIQVRNGEYRVFDNKVCSGGIYNKTDWTDFCSAFHTRRDWIIKEAKHYKVAKKTLI